MIRFALPLLLISISLAAEQTPTVLPGPAPSGDAPAPMRPNQFVGALPGTTARSDADKGKAIAHPWGQPRGSLRQVSVTDVPIVVRSANGTSILIREITVMSKFLITTEPALAAPEAVILKGPGGTTYLAMVRNVLLRTSSIDSIDLREATMAAVPPMNGATFKEERPMTSLETFSRGASMAAGMTRAFAGIRVVMRADRQDSISPGEAQALAEACGAERLAATFASTDGVPLGIDEAIEKMAAKTP